MTWLSIKSYYIINSAHQPEAVTMNQETQQTGLA